MTSPGPLHLEYMLGIGSLLVYEFFNVPTTCNFSDIHTTSKNFEAKWCCDLPNHSWYVGSFMITQLVTFMTSMILPSNLIVGCDFAFPGPFHLEHIVGPQSLLVYRCFYAHVATCMTRMQLPRQCISHVTVLYTPYMCSCDAYCSYWWITYCID